MKKSLVRLSAVFTMVILLFAGCGIKEYDEEKLIGTWKASDGYNYTFHPDYTGLSTDSNGRGLSFTWDLSFDELEIRFTGSGQSGKAAYLTFVIESMTDTKMTAYDKNDPDETIITFTK